MKTVRIISPHSTRSDSESEESEDSREKLKVSLVSPPPGLSSLENPFTADSEEPTPITEDHETRHNTIQNTGPYENFSQRTATAIVAAQNPFKRTTVVSNTYLPEVSASTDQEGLETEQASKLQYDVDEFKKLLLTGEKRPTISPSTKAPMTAFGQGYDTSSTANISSHSRQSLFEPNTSAFSDPPQTSQESSPPEGTSQSLANLAVGPDKAKPSTPRHRHGKSIKEYTPQTVSVEDLTFSRSEIVEKLAQSVDQEKTLPAPPPREVTTAPETDESASESWSLLGQQQVPDSDKTSTKRVRPAPPAARKAGQNRPISIHTAIERLPYPERPRQRECLSPSSPPSSPPPPPPPRRSATIHGGSSSSVLTVASLASSSDRSIGGESPKPLPRTRPAASGRRNSGADASKAVTPLSASPSKVPPAPPPRRRGSSQSSYTPSRLSGDYRSPVTERLRSDSGASSISHLAMTPMEPSPDRQDIMADLSALQREVDELRGKIGE